MPTNTYTPLANITLGSSASTITFSSISQAYKDLVIVTSLVSSGTYASASMRMNGDTGSNYSYVFAVDGPSSFSGTSSAMSLFWSGFASGGNVTSIVQVMDYSATDKHKTSLFRINKFDSEGNSVGMAAQRWASTSAVTSFSIYSSGGYGQPFAAGTTVSLFGVAA